MLTRIGFGALLVQSMLVGCGGSAAPQERGGVLQPGDPVLIGAGTGGAGVPAAGSGAAGSASQGTFPIAGIAGITGGAGRAVAGSQAGTAGASAGFGGTAGALDPGHPGLAPMAGAAGAVPPSTGVQGGTAEPQIPAPKGMCPTLATGGMMIMGAAIQLWTGVKSTTQKAPILIYWHYTGGNAAVAPGDLGSSIMADIMAQGGVVASMESAGGNSPTTDWGVFRTDDFNVVDQIVACAVAQFNIDTKRIYTSGSSAGGLAAGALLFMRSSYVAAGYTNSGGQAGFPQLMVLQDPLHVPNVMTMHGAMGNDKVVIEFTQSSLTEDMAIAAKGGFAIDCDHGGAHIAAPPNLKAAGWEFLKAHPFGVKPFPYAAGLPASFPAYCKVIGK
jgi:hypothetical protein